MDWIESLGRPTFPCRADNNSRYNIIDCPPMRTDWLNGWAGRTRSVVVTINSTYLSLVHCCSSKHGPNHHHHHSHSRHPPIQLSAYHSVGSPQFRRTTRVNTTRSFCLYRGKYLLAWLAGWPPPVIDHPPPRTTNITIDSTVLQTNTHTLNGIEIDRVTATGWWRRKWLTTKHLLERLF